MTLSRFLTHLLPKELSRRTTWQPNETTELPTTDPALFELFERLAGAQAVESLPSALWSRLADLLAVDCLRLVGWDPRSDRLQLLAGPETAFAPALERPVVARILQQGEPLTLYRQAMIMKGSQKALLDSGPWQAVLLLPLATGEAVLGYLALYRGAEREPRFSRATIAFGQAMAAQLAAVHQRQRLAGQLAAERAQRRRMAGQVVAAQEAERCRLSRELHDELGQALTALKINLDLARRALPDDPPPALVQSLAEARSLSVHVLEAARDLSHELRPMLLDDLGLVAALRWQLDRHEQQTGQRTRFEARLGGLTLPAALEITLYRVVQEGLTNISRHAAAQTVRLSLRRQGETLVVVIRDDGVGFDPERVFGSVEQPDGLGLTGMRERVALLHGQLSIEARPGQGTRIEARFPLDDSESDLAESG